MARRLPNEEDELLEDDLPEEVTEDSDEEEEIDLESNRRDRFGEAHWDDYDSDEDGY